MVAAAGGGPCPFDEAAAVFEKSASGADNFSHCLVIYRVIRREGTDNPIEFARREVFAEVSISPALKPLFAGAVEGAEFFADKLRTAGALHNFNCSTFLASPAFRSAHRWGSGSL